MSVSICSKSEWLHHPFTHIRMAINWFLWCIHQSYVSIYTYVVQGPYEHLKGPFQGEITIQIVNQAGDHDHVERTISYANITPGVHAGIPSCRSRWCGFRTFLAHSALHYDAAKKTQYLKDNHLIVRMVKVSLPAA